MEWITHMEDLLMVFYRLHLTELYPFHRLLQIYLQELCYIQETQEQIITSQVDMEI